MPRAVVTGGAGFLPSHLCDLLRANGYAFVTLAEAAEAFARAT